MIRFFPIALTLLISFSTQANDYIDNDVSYAENEIILNDELSTQDQEYFYNFGRVRINRSASVTFTLYNRGRTPIYINDIDIEGNGFSRNDNCSSLLFSGQRCRIRINFRPRHVGRHEGELEIELTGAQDIKIELRGRGVRNNNGGWD